MFGVRKLIGVMVFISLGLCVLYEINDPNIVLLLLAIDFVFMLI